MTPTQRRSFYSFLATIVILSEAPQARSRRIPQERTPHVRPHIRQIPRIERAFPAGKLHRSRRASAHLAGYHRRCAGRRHAGAHLRRPPDGHRHRGRCGARPLQPPHHIHRLRPRIRRQRRAHSRCRYDMGTELLVVRRTGPAGSRGRHPRHDRARRAAASRHQTRRRGPPTVHGVVAVARFAGHHRRARVGGAVHRPGRRRAVAVVHGRPLVLGSACHRHHPALRGRGAIGCPCERRRRDRAAGRRAIGRWRAAHRHPRAVPHRRRADGLHPAHVRHRHGHGIVPGPRPARVLHGQRPSRAAGLRAVDHVAGPAGKLARLCRVRSASVASDMVRAVDVRHAVGRGYSGRAARLPVHAAGRARAGRERRARLGAAGLLHARSHSRGVARQRAGHAELASAGGGARCRVRHLGRRQRTGHLGGRRRARRLLDGHHGLRRWSRAACATSTTSRPT